MGFQRVLCVFFFNCENRSIENEFVQKFSVINWMLICLFFFSDFEVYLKSKIVEVHPIPNDEKVSCYSEPNASGPRRALGHFRMSSVYNPVDTGSTRKMQAHDSRASVYFTPQDSIDQPQLQMSPMHINYIRENLDSYCLKPIISNPKFDFEIHRLQTDLEKEIDRRRSQYQINSEEYESAGDDFIEIDSEKTKMLNNIDSMENAMGTDRNYIRMNTLPKRNKFKRFNGGNKDLYYSLENLFDGNDIGDVASNFYQMNTSTKTIDEASETQLTSSASDNCSSNEATHSNQLNGNGLLRNNPQENVLLLKNQNPSQSVLVLNTKFTNCGFNDATISNSMPNICETTKEMNKHDVVNDVKTVNNQIQIEQ